MQIKTKFEINNMVKPKYENHPHEWILVMEVKEISSTTCYAGTQVFYFCRHIFASKEYESFKNDGDFTWKVSHGMSSDKTQIGWHKYREDEIVAASKEAIAIIQNRAK